MDQSGGFVFGYELDGNGGGRSVSVDHTGARDYWLHVDYSVPETHQWLGDQGLNPLVVENLIRFETRPRALMLNQIER